MPPNQTTLLTVEEFAKIKDPPGGRYELLHGELVLVPPPKLPRYPLQQPTDHPLQVRFRPRILGRGSKAPDDPCETRRCGGLRPR